MLSPSERKVLNAFRDFRMRPDQMLCFSGIDLEQKSAAIDELVHKQLLTRERFRGGFSLTVAGFRAMKACG